jgi:hypothetical protein
MNAESSLRLSDYFLYHGFQGLKTVSTEATKTRGADPLLRQRAGLRADPNPRAPHGRKDGRPYAAIHISAANLPVRPCSARCENQSSVWQAVQKPAISIWLTPDRRSVS